MRISKQAQKEFAEQTEHKEPKSKKGKKKEPEPEPATVVDLNGDKSQQKIINYIKYGVPSSDSKGHFIPLSVKVIPIQADILENIREKTKKKYWKNQSQLIRSILAVGTYVMLQFLNRVDDIDSLSKEFKLADLINQLNKRKREEELAIEVREMIRDLNKVKDPFDVDETIKVLQSYVR